MTAAGGPRLLHRPVPPDWDDAYAIRAHVPEADAILAALAGQAAAFRAALGARARLDLPYPGPLGDAARERFDLFPPEGTPRGLCVFIHGGYWQAFDKSAWSHLAAGPLARGWTVAMPSYTLAPAARIAEMTRQMAAFLDAAAAEVAGPIAVAGHSAGGQLAARMICDDLAPRAQARIARVVSISGVHDLRPLLATAMAGTLRLDPAEAAAESPALRAPVAGARLTAWVGAAERPEFLRQAELLANVWAGLGAETRLAVAPGRHHFDVIAGLTQADDPLCAALVGD